MELTSYISDPEARNALAKKLKTSPQYLWQIASGWRGARPSPKMAIRIEEATNGKVPKSSLRPDLWQRAA